MFAEKCKHKNHDKQNKICKIKDSLEQGVFSSCGQGGLNPGRVRGREGEQQQGGRGVGIHPRVGRGAGEHQQVRKGEEHQQDGRGEGEHQQSGIKVGEHQQGRSGEGEHQQDERRLGEHQHRGRKDQKFGNELWGKFLNSSNQRRSEQIEPREGKSKFTDSLTHISGII